MQNIKLLDCTLRDGGFVNDWNFGHDTLINIIDRLISAKIDIIEIGFLDERRKFDINRSIMPDTKSIKKIYGNLNKNNTMIVGMIDYGTCNIEKLCLASDCFLDGIRVIFKKQSITQALEFCKQIQNMGYKVFVQPVSITNYSDEELLNLLELVNELKPYSISIVDTYGLLHKDNLMHYFNIMNKELSAEICIGYHSHNNFQLAYSNSIEMLTNPTERTIVLDGSIYGMGKGAGNANIELLAMRMNESYGSKYDINQILEIIDTTILNIFRKTPWGYSLHYFLSASNDCHPSYVKHLIEKQTLSIKSLNEILGMIIPKKRLEYNEEHIEELYLTYQKNDCNDEKALKVLSNELKNANILLLGPGMNAIKQKNEINEYINILNPIIIAINYIPEEFKVDYIFISNSKRYIQLTNQLNEEKKKNIKMIATSNVTKTSGIFDFTLKYSTLLDKNAAIIDNSFLMFLKIMKKIEVKNITLAGFDGYAIDNTPNYLNANMEYNFTIDEAKNLNKYVIDKLNEIKNDLNIQFITKSYYNIKE